MKNIESFESFESFIFEQTTTKAPLKGEALLKSYADSKGAKTKDAGFLFAEILDPSKDPEYDLRSDTEKRVLIKSAPGEDPRLYRNKFKELVKAIRSNPKGNQWNAIADMDKDGTILILPNNSTGVNSAPKGTPYTNIIQYKWEPSKSSNGEFYLTALTPAEKQRIADDLGSTT